MLAPAAAPLFASCSLPFADDFDAESESDEAEVDDAWPCDEDGDAVALSVCVVLEGETAAALSESVLGTEALSCATLAVPELQQSESYY